MVPEMRILWPTIVVVTSGALLSGCAIPYYWQAVGGHLGLLAKRTPIETVIQDQGTSSVTQEALREVLEIRRFALEELGLPDNGSYQSYVDLERPYVVWNVVAAEEFSVDPMSWCFPFAGCVTYRGYFSEEDARQFAAALGADGLDTYVGGATAYSTLGYFKDPVLNTMLTGDGSTIAALLFHELAHQKLYIKGDSALSEAFASAIEEYGTESWLADRARPEDIAAYRDRMRRRTDFTNLIVEQQERLRSVYADPVSEASKRSAKEAAFEVMREDYEALKQTWGGATEYDAWFARPLNNARLASVTTYRRWLPGLRWRLQELGLQGFYAEMAELGERTLEDRREALEGWVQAALSARRSAEIATVAHHRADDSGTGAGQHSSTSP